MPDVKNYILQFTDELTKRKSALRIDSEDAALPLVELLNKYLKDSAIQALLDERRITRDSADTLQDLQDFVYISSDNGQLYGMFDGVVFKHHDSMVDVGDALLIQSTKVNDTPVALIDVSIDRMNVGYDRNWIGFHKRRWDRRAAFYLNFVANVVGESLPVEEANRVMQLETTGDKLKFVKALAKNIWHSDFENYSRFIGNKLPYKTGDETVRNIVGGGGGICSEKVQALKFITDHYGLRSEYILAGADARDSVPEDRLRELLTTFDFRFSKRYMRYWQHVALLYTIDDTNVLVDVTNGNIPFLFLKDDASHRVIGDEDKQPIKVRMAVQDEDFYYHRVSQDIPEKLFFAMEGWIQDIDLIQVFDNELGLYISQDFFITPIVYRTPRVFKHLKRQYAQACEQAGLTYAVSDQWNLDNDLGQNFMQAHPDACEKLLSTLDHLLACYDECHGECHEAGLVVIGLGGGREEVPNA